MSAFSWSLFVALIITCAAQLALAGGIRPRVHRRRGRKPAPPRGVGLWVGLAVSTLVLAAFQELLPLPRGEHKGFGPPLWGVVLAAVPVLTAALISDRSRPRSERHILGLLMSGVVMALAGFSIFILTAPGQGTVALAPLLVLVVTILWLLLLASMTELVSLVPGGLVLFGIALALVVWLSGGHQQTVASYALAGIIVGAMIGRIGADAIRGRHVAWGRAEVFALGVWLTAMTNVAFLKGVALAGFVLPLGVIAVGVVVVSIRAFERSLLLRNTPGAPRG